MRPPHAWLFDLDGTLLDSLGDLADAANAARAAVGLEPWPEADVARHIGHGLGHLLQGVLPAELHPRMGAARAAFIAHYRANLLARSRPYPGVQPMFDALGGAPLGLVTNKPGMFVDAILDGLGWSARFQAVVAGDTLAARKPDPAPLLHALDILGVTPARAAYVGDSEVDRDAALAAGVRFIAVAWGRVAGATAETVDWLPDLARC